MNTFKKYIVWVTIIATLATMSVPVATAYAASLSDLTSQTTNSGGGKGIFDVLLGLLVGNLLSKVFHITPSGDGTTSGGSNPGSPGGSLTGTKEVMGFYAEWWGGDTSSYNDMTRNANTLKTIIPFWGTLQADGSVTDRGGNDHASVVKFAHQNNIKVLLMVNNAKQDSSTPPVHTVLSSPTLRSTAINNLEAYIKQNNLDGVNIDFEMVPAEDRDNLSAFMRELYQRLKPQGYIVSIDVFPKTDENNDVSVAYDFAQLAQYADRIAIMTYDNHGTWSGPGPIAAINWVEANLKYALKYIPKNKLYLGIAGYGYDWSSKGVESLEYGAIQNLISRFGSTAQWDDSSKSPYFTYTGTDGVSHTVWYENSRSLGYKLDLVNKYDIAGAALWKLGEEDPGAWKVFRDKLFQ